MNDLELSETVVSQILSKLVETGLKGRDISTDDLDEATKITEDFFSSIMNWLGDEKIIRHRGSSIDGIDRDKSHYHMVVLTAYGLYLLGQKISIGEEDITLGRAIKNVSEHNSNYANFGEFFGGTLGALFKSFS